jgi:hypothetical protein
VPPGGGHAGASCRRARVVSGDESTAVGSVAGVLRVVLAGLNGAASIRLDWRSFQFSPLWACSRRPRRSPGRAATDVESRDFKRPDWPFGAAGGKTGQQPGESVSDAGSGSVGLLVCERCRVAGARADHVRTRHAASARTGDRCPTRRRTRPVLASPTPCRLRPRAEREPAVTGYEIRETRSDQRETGQ